MHGMSPLLPRVVPILSAGLMIAAVALWLTSPPAVGVQLRTPGRDRDPNAAVQVVRAPNRDGDTIAGPGSPGADLGSWPTFRGPDRDNIDHDSPPLIDRLEAVPPVLWDLPVGDGHAGPAVHRGRVYLLDYDVDARRDVYRCLSADDGREIWRYSYPVPVAWNHGHSRTVVAIGEGVVVGLGPKGHVTCLDAETGQLRWALDPVADMGTTVPPWYAGQCPVIDAGRVIIAPGADPFMLALEPNSGEVLWQTPNPGDWQMTHSSILPIEIAGRDAYVYCASRGVAIVEADTGRLMGTTTDWKISIANVPTPVDLGGGRLLFSGGYRAGSAFARIEGAGSSIELTRRLDDRTFGAAQQTPIYHEGHVYGVRPDGQMTCLDSEGNVLWTSGPSARFGLGPFLLADGKLLVLDESATLSMIRATPDDYEPLGSAALFDGESAWAPMAIVAGRLILRDRIRMMCIDLRKDASP